MKYNQDCYTVGYGALFVSSADVFNSVPLLGKVPLITTDSRPADCVATSASDKGHFVMSTLYQDREWLEFQYRKRKLTQKQIAALCGCAVSTICVWMQKYGIEARSHSQYPSPNPPKKAEIKKGIKVWQCGTCSEWLPKSEFYADKRTPNGLKSQCKKCHIETSIRTRDKDADRKRKREYMRRARRRNPEKLRAREREASRKRKRGRKYRARMVLNNAIRRGKIVRPTECECCGRDGLGIHGHHKDYNKPLDVDWLCTECHGVVHRG